MQSWTRSRYRFSSLQKSETGSLFPPPTSTMSSALWQASDQRASQLSPAWLKFKMCGAVIFFTPRSAAPPPWTRSAAPPHPVSAWPGSVRTGRWPACSGRRPWWDRSCLHCWCRPAAVRSRCGPPTPPPPRGPEWNVWWGPTAGESTGSDLRKGIGCTLKKK